MLTALVFDMILLEKASALNYISCQMLSAPCSLATFVFAVLGLFFADKWWYGIVALALGLFVGSIISTIAGKNKLLLSTLGSLAIFIAPIATIIMFIVWY